MTSNRLSLSKVAVLMVLMMCFSGLAGGCSDKKGATGGGSSTQAAQQQAAEKYDLKIYTLANGTSTYVLGVGFADMINKNSTWLKATALESPSNGTNAKILSQDPDAQKHAIAAAFIRDAILGLSPFEKPYMDLRDVASYGASCNFFVTTNPNIRTLKDLDGKRVSLMTKPSMIGVDVFLKYFEEIGIKVMPEYLGQNNGPKALMDGKVDACLVGPLAASSDFRTWAGNPALEELFARARVYYLGLDKDVLLKARKQLGLPVNACTVEIPAGQFPGQDAPIVAQANLATWACHKDLPDRVVKEVLRIMKEHASEFKQYHRVGACISPQVMAYSEFGSKYMHPAAVEFYRENGITIPEELKQLN